MSSRGDWPGTGVAVRRRAVSLLSAEEFPWYRFLACSLPRELAMSHYVDF